MALEALPTEYGGARFRSRTEARWAVFFDHLGIRWEYEAQGFDAGGDWYLPDFLLFPACGMLWAEVKGSWESEGIDRWRKFAPWRPQPSRTVILIGTPQLGDTALVIGGREDGNPHAGPWEDEQEWRPCPSGYHFDFAYAGTFRSKYAEDGCSHDPSSDRELRLRRAYDAATTHRFGIHDGGATD